MYLVRVALVLVSTLPALIMPRGHDIFDLPTGAQKDIENFAFDHQGRTVRLGDAMQADSLDGYLVVQNGELLFERYYDNFSAHDHHIWFSMTKSLISTAFGIAQAEFGIDESKTPADYLPELAGSVFGEISLRYLSSTARRFHHTGQRRYGGHCL